MKKLVEWLGWVVLAVVILIVSFVITASHNGWEFDAVLSGSMEPEYEVGGLVVIKPEEAQNVEIGDVISFRLPGIATPICHRVIDITEIDGNLQFQTKGDANEEPDLNLVQAQDVTGKTVFYLPYIGYIGHISQLGRTPIGLMGRRYPSAVILIFIIGLIFISSTLKDMHEEIFQPWKKRRKERLKKQKEILLKRKKALGLG